MEFFTKDTQRSAASGKRIGLILETVVVVMGAIIGWLVWERTLDAKRIDTARVTAERAEAARQKAEAVRIASIPRTREVPATTDIFHGQITIEPRAYGHARFRVTPEMKDAHLIGNFIAAGNLHQAIDAVVIGETDLLNFQNEHNPKTYYSTGGLKTTDQFDVALSPGSYVLVFSNRDAILRKVYVTANVDLNYTRTETVSARN